MSSIDQEAGLDEPVEKVIEDLDGEQVEVVSPGGGFRMPEWFFIRRLDEPIEKYMQHPLNFSNSEGMGYVLRGFSALAGGILNYWWMDVLGGFLRIRKESASSKPPIFPLKKEGGETL